MGGVIEDILMFAQAKGNRTSSFHAVRDVEQVKKDDGVIGGSLIVLMQY